MTSKREKIVVATIRCSPTDAVLRGLQTAYPDKDIMFTNIEPRNPEEADAMIEKSGAVVTLLNPEPLPSLAIKRGKRFIAIREDDVLHEVVSVNPILKPFTP